MLKYILIMITPEELLKNGLHLGHKKQRCHPKAKKYIYSFDNGIAILDLFQTKTKLESALECVITLAKNDKTILVVATKKTVAATVKAIVEPHNIPYLTTKWVGGFLTNFSTVKKNIDHLNSLITQRDNNEWADLPKHERLAKEKLINRTLFVYQGVLQMKKIPDALFIIDIKKEKNSVVEAGKMKITTIAITDTNVNPDLVDYAIPANDDALSSVTYITNLIINTYNENRPKDKKPIITKK